MRRLVLATSTALLAALPGSAMAGDSTALTINSTLVKPLGAEGLVSESSGVGGDIILFPDDNMMVQIGGYGVIGRNQTDRTARDIYDVHIQLGLATAEQPAALAGFAALGLDVLSVTTRSKDQTLRGTTMGMSAQAGLIGTIADKVVYKASASYLGAIVPGTGDDLGGLVLQLAAGLRFD